MTNLIPFNSNGDLVYWSIKRHSTHDEWIENFTFTDTLIFKEYKNTNNSILFVFTKESDNKLVHFTPKNFPILEIKDGKITGTFTFINKGASFSCIKI